jgi:amino acid transporter
MTVLYIAGTLSVLLALPSAQISGLEGIMQAIQAITSRLGLPWLVPIVAVFVTINALGGVGGWFAATARLPFVAGIDRFLPPAFGELHPRWHTPYVALLVQAGIAAAVHLSRAGRDIGAGRVSGARQHGDHRLLHPFLFMFAAMIVLQREPAGPKSFAYPAENRWRSCSRRSASS